MSRNDKDWDKEFDDLIANTDDLPEINADRIEDAIGNLKGNASEVDEGDLKIPDLQKPENQRCIAVILTPVRDVSDLYALLAIHGVEAQVMQTETGAIVYQEYEVSASDAFEELLGDERPLPNEAVELAKLVSSMMAFYGAVLCVSWLSDAPDETSQLCGQVVAKRYVDQKFDANLPAGQLISGVNSIVEDLLLGLATPEDVSDVRQTKTMSAFQAWRYLRKRLRSRHGDDDPQSMLDREMRSSEKDIHPNEGENSIRDLQRNIPDDYGVDNSVDVGGSPSAQSENEKRRPDVDSTTDDDPDTNTKESS